MSAHANYDDETNPEIERRVRRKWGGGYGYSYGCDGVPGRGCGYGYASDGGVLPPLPGPPPMRALPDRPRNGRGRNRD